MKSLSEDKRKKGCPICNGIDSKFCMRCYGNTRMCDWYQTQTGWRYQPVKADVRNPCCKDMKPDPLGYDLVSPICGRIA